VADGGLVTECLRVTPEVRRVSRPFVFDGLFGWYHADPSGGGADVAVLICGTLSREALDSHHSLRVLADAFAQAGYPTMRFDYAGSGDSYDLPRGGEQGADDSSELWAIWQRNIHDAADKLREITGASRLILCGLRIGATLAAIVSESREDVVGLMLLAPVLRGRSYIRQLRLESELGHGKAAVKTAGLEFHELSLAPDTVDLISAIELRQVKLRAGLQVAIFSETPTRPLAECISTWTERAVTVESYGFEGLEPLLCPDTQGYKEPAAAAGMIEWMTKANAAQPHLADLRSDAMQQDLLLSGCLETPLFFGQQQKLFGVLCRPDGRISETAVIIVNTGRNPRAGIGRFGVEFARRLADVGITSLRFDFAGLGDSLGLAGEEDMRSDVFEDDRCADISAAIDALEQLGCRRFVVHGICSGAYHALHAAAAETRIEAVLMINLPLFLWKEGDSIAESKKRTYSFSHYGTKLVEPAYWARLLRGESDVLGTVKGQLSRLTKLVRWPGHGKSRQEAMDPVSFARRLMATLGRAKTKTLFLFDPGHAGAYEIQNLFGKGGTGLKAFAGAEIQMVPGLGEAVGQTSARKTAAALMIDFISGI
jgi:alpha-beta hydrolase superfamily lysophospholipase